MSKLAQIIKNRLCELSEHWDFNESTAIFLANEIAYEIEEKERTEYDEAKYKLWTFDNKE